MLGVSLSAERNIIKRESREISVPKAQGQKPQWSAHDSQRQQIMNQQASVRAWEYVVSKHCLLLHPPCTAEVICQQCQETLPISLGWSSSEKD